MGNFKVYYTDIMTLREGCCNVSAGTEEEARNLFNYYRGDTRKVDFVEDLDNIEIDPYDIAE